MAGTTHITIHTNSCPGGEGGGPVGLVVSQIPPNPLAPSTSGNSNLWWDTNDGQLYVWTGSEWVAANCCSEGIAVGPAPPLNPGVGTLWWDTNDGQLYIWTGSTWVAASCCADTDTGAVISVFGRTGAVVAANGDYAFSQISGVAVPAQLPLFTATANGAVPAPGASTPITYVLQANGQWAAPGTGGGGTVTSVAMTVPGGLAVSGTPITSAGTLALTWSGTIPNAQVPAPTASALGGVQSATAPANQFATGITTSGALTFAQPSFGNLSGSIALGQLPAIANNTVLGNVSGATATPSALTQAQLTALINLFSTTASGAVPTSPGGTTTFLRADGIWAAPPGGGGGTVNSVAMTVPTGLAVAGSPVTSSGTLAVTWSGTIPNAQVPPPTTTALGGVISSSAPANQFATGITTAGAVTYAQPSFSNISGQITTGQLPPGTGTVTSVGMTVPSGLAVSGSPITTNGTLGVTWSGTIPNAQVPAPTASALGGVTSASASAGQFVTGINTSGALQFGTPASRMPTIQRFTSGSGTYTPAAGVSWIRVRMCAGGGGGGGGGNATAGGNTTFGGWTCVGGGLGNFPSSGTGGSGGTGGTGGANGTGTLVVRVAGGYGSVGLSVGTGSTAGLGGTGGSSYFGSANAYGGGGIAGGAVAGQAAQGSGGGGGAGEYAEFVVSSPSATAYAVGANGAGSGGNAFVSAGLPGFAGIIIVEENY